MAHQSAGTLLCVANFPANTGFAWDFIERFYARLADHLAGHGISTLVAYPAIAGPPQTLAGSAARAVLLDAAAGTYASIQATAELIRRERVRVVYFSDQAAWHWGYPLLRWAGAQRILVHDHTSGERTPPRGLKRLAKWLLMRCPGVTADVVVAVAEYVRRRQLEVGMFPEGRVYRIRHGLAVQEAPSPADRRAHTLMRVSPDRPVVVCACRASPVKGVHHLLRAFDRVASGWADRGPRPALLFLGDGPQMEELRALHSGLASRDDVLLAGYRPDASDIVNSADLIVVPSLWHEAFPLAVLEAMARGKPIIASAVGGIPEMIEHDQSGLLVPAGNEPALAEAMGSLLSDRARAARLGEAARRRVKEQFTPEKEFRSLARLIEEGFGTPCAELG